MVRGLGLRILCWDSIEIKVNLIIGMRQPIKYFKVGSSNYPSLCCPKKQQVLWLIFWTLGFIKFIGTANKNSPTFLLPTSTRGMSRDACFHLKLKPSLFRAPGQN